MVRPIEVKALNGYRVWLQYSDGTKGEVDLSHLAGRGVFKCWEDKKFYNSVYLTDAGAIAWGYDIELCPDTLYMRLTGKSVEEVMPGVKATRADA